ncbi:hypothetical protein CGZ80_14475 [Rhodopirellula sp. MGV]|nr:hypothetical protein CGZ80_14475 [Rhodopirellula sp. MGV]PNY37320.1 hypothetical protein C2E31_08560 [Rhodopirellula baltica]
MPGDRERIVRRNVCKASQNVFAEADQIGNEFYANQNARYCGANHPDSGAKLDQPTYVFDKQPTATLKLLFASF